MFNEANIYPNAGVDLDCFVAMFKPEVDVLLWCTYFGGEAGPVQERIWTLCAKEHSLFAGGQTSKWTDINSYFPLEPSVSPAYFDGSYNDIGTYPADGFLTKFCSLHSKTMETISVESVQRSTHCQIMGDGWFKLIGNGTGPFLDIYDTCGRKCATYPVIWTGEGSIPIQIQGLRAGTYFVLTDGMPTTKVIILE